VNGVGRHPSGAPSLLLGGSEQPFSIRALACQLCGRDALKLAGQSSAVSGSAAQLVLQERGSWGPGRQSVSPMLELLTAPRQDAKTYVEGYKKGFAAGLKVRRETLVDVISAFRGVREVEGGS
jgi:hypothetical protein